MSLFLNGVETNTVMLNGIETTGVWNGEVVWGVPQFKTLTLYHSEGGTLTANELTGYPGDTINLSTAYNTYWRFSGYQLTGDGTLANNTYTFGDEDATICACYKKNAFTATGGFDKGSDTSVTTNNGYKATNVSQKYAIHNAHTGTIPASWYSTSNRWNPSNASAYKITLNSKMGFQAVTTYRSTQIPNGARFYITATTIIGSTESNTQTITGNFTQANSKTANNYYSKSITSNIQGYYGVSARLSAYAYNSNWNVTNKYIASRTSGTWTATGYAP